MLTSMDHNSKGILHFWLGLTEMHVITSVSTDSWEANYVVSKFCVLHVSCTITSTNFLINADCGKQLY